jgi:hypothetical protein
MHFTPDKQVKTGELFENGLERVENGLFSPQKWMTQVIEHAVLLPTTSLVDAVSPSRNGGAFLT